ncbi:hypothetical protein DFH11DRAFT_1583254 [Phellopilus nigrolimitatus]|nr:hypothetical protein DFH11DRAFT_1583254 [Phellopilus nigrolimitatus]
MTTFARLNLDTRFLDTCRDYAKPVANKSSLSGDPDASKTTRLTDKYPNAFSDFYGCGTPCVFKSGPSWPVNKGPQAQGIVREARPIYDHPIQPVWLDIGTKISQALDSMAVKWTSIGPRAYANAGKSELLCPFVLRVGVVPHSLLYEDAVAATTIVEKIFTEASFEPPVVAFVESLVTRSAGPKLLPFNPLLDDIPELRKPFTPTLGLAIAPSKYPFYEGTASLYYRLSGNNNGIAVLTCAHVARPLPVYPNTGLTGSHREGIVALGTMAYNNAVESIMAAIGNRLQSIDSWNRSIQRLGEAVEGENPMVTERRNEFLHLVEKAEKEIEEANKLHNEVTKNLTTIEQRTIGHVLHSEKIEVSVEPHGYTKDWALIELVKGKIDWDAFQGNKVFVGGNFSVADYGNIMFPQPDDRKNYVYPDDGLLQAFGVVQDSDLRKPQHLDANKEKCLLVVKNGLATGTTIGRVNGLESFTRTYETYGISHTSIEIAVLRYGSPGRFSDGGDSGSIVLDREGRIVGILTGGEGPTDETDTTYLTPYWWIEKQIKEKFPDIALYERVE